ncbi:MAG: Molybdopterin molybdenumtransferase [Verrucomicrobiae bacterium]|nr:Molybdopterin molybdenumtransferase [Verrucomicrobiae bacterium]
MASCNVHEARQQILHAVHLLPGRRESLSAAAGCVLAADVVSPGNLPPWDNSAMDGYAVRAADVSSASQNNPLHLRVTGAVAAGQAAAVPVEPLTCQRIFTGAPLPPGADAVVMQEDTRSHPEGFVAILEAVEVGENIRRVGEDVPAGVVVLPAGTVLGPGQAALAAALGFAELEVHPRPRVGVLVTGAELVEPGRPLQVGQIYDSNSFAIAGWLRAAGCEPVELGIADDTKEDLAEKIDYALSECDALITVGGVSVGEYDLVKAVLEELGCHQSFWKVNMKPGKPFVFGTRGRQLIFGLPGNPVSAAVTFLILARPALLKLRGVTDVELPAVSAVVEEDFVNRGERPHFMRGRLERRDGHWQVRPLAQQGSHMLTSLAKANCLVEVAEASTITRGTIVKCQTF